MMGLQNGVISTTSQKGRNPFQLEENYYCFNSAQVYIHGNTEPCKLFSMPLFVHPHMRGEYYSASYFAGIAIGSPPHAMDAKTKRCVMRYALRVMMEFQPLF